MTIVTRIEGARPFSSQADLAVFIIERPKNPRLVASKIVNSNTPLFISSPYDENFGRPRET